MINLVTVDSVSSEIEEEVSVIVCGQRLTCFASYLPYEIKVGGVYSAELLPVIFDNYIIEEIECSKPKIVREGLGYSYDFIGKLKDGCIYCGDLVFCDDVLLTDFGFFDGKLISWKIDRLDILFSK